MSGFIPLKQLFFLRMLLVFRDQERESDSCTPSNLRLLTNSTGKPIHTDGRMIISVIPEVHKSFLVLVTFRARLLL